MKKRLLSGLLSLLMLLTMLPAAFAADEADSDTETVIAQNNVRVDTSKQQTESPELETVSDPSSEKNTTPLEQPNAAGEEIYVSSSGDDENGGGTEQNPYATLAKAVENARDGATIYLLSDLTSTKYAIVNEKKITINGNGYTVTRGEDFQAWNDGGRGGYNPAMIEVANGSTLTLRNITLDDYFKTKGTDFLEQPTGEGNKNNENKVQDAIIAAYYKGGTIILDQGTILKNFGGMSAVRIGGQGKDDLDSSKLVMRAGSKIVDDEMGNRKGGAAAVWSQGGIVYVQKDAQISSIDGRALYLEDGGYASICGEISNITANDVMNAYPDQSTEKGQGVMDRGFGGVAIAAMNSSVMIGSTGSIREIKTDEDAENPADVMLWLVGATFETEQGSVIEDIDIIGLADSNGSTMRLDGRVENCNLKKVLFRVRGSRGTFELQENGIITNCSTTDAGVIYENMGIQNITIAGEISNITASRAIHLSASRNGVQNGGACTITGVIKNISGYGIRAQGPTDIYINGGEISGCSGYAINYAMEDDSLLEINGGTIQNNNGGNAQISINGVSATNICQYAKISAGTIIGNKTIDLIPFDVTLDEDYDAVKLGNASAEAAGAIKNAVTTEHKDWTVVGSSALWFQPSEETLHFTASRHYSVKNTGLFAAIIPLHADGTPAADELVQFVVVQNTDPIDVSLTDLIPGQSYAMMFVNNNIYTLAPDDITIYDGDKLPSLSINNSIDLNNSDDLTSLEINGVAQGNQNVSADTTLLSLLLENLEAVYLNEDNQEINTENVIDLQPGEYVVTLRWKNNLKNSDVKVNGNQVNLNGKGTLIVRFIEDEDELEANINTYPLLKEEPTESVSHAEAIASEPSPRFYTNDDEDREVGATGIQLLDDSLLIDEDGTNRQSLLEAKAAEYLGSPEVGKAYAYDFHYLDLVDAHNGNAWVSASNGTTVYLPYPDGTDKNTDFKLVHFKDLHREYGISGQADVEAAIEACELETVDITKADAGIRFDVKKAGFSPFALVWTVDAPERNVAFQSGSHGTLLGTTTFTVTSGSVFGDDGRTIPTVIPNSDYEFSGWLGSDSVTYTSAQVLALSITNDMTFTAQYQYTGGNHGGDDDGSGDGGGSTTTYYTLTYDSNGGTEYDDERYVRNRVVELDKEPTREGYVFTGWYADEELTDRITEIKMTSNKTVYAGWEESTVPDWLNGDDHFAYVTGYPDGTVKPQNDISRAEVATIFFRLLDPDIRDQYLTQTSQFTDVSADAWYSTAVSTMAALGILNGRTADTFVPDAPITRAEFAAICARFDDSDVQKENAFTDISGHWAEDEIERAAALSWIGGYPNGTFLPDNEITRAEAMTMINRVLQRLPETEDDLLDDMNVWPDNQPQDWYYLAVQEATNSHDFDRKDDSVHEHWTGMNADPDWSQYQ